MLKDAHGGGWSDVYICHSLEELFEAYDDSGQLTMVLQEFIEWDQYIRCLCLGPERGAADEVRSARAQISRRARHLAPELGARVVKDSLTLVRALGYDMNTVEWAVRDGIPYAIDFMNPAPDMDINSLTPHYFDWTVTHMADLAIRLAKATPRKMNLERGEFLLGRREG